MRHHMRNFLYMMINVNDYYRHAPGARYPHLLYVFRLLRLMRYMQHATICAISARANNRRVNYYVFLASNAMPMHLSEQ